MVLEFVEVYEFLSAVVEAEELEREEERRNEVRMLEMEEVRDWKRVVCILRWLFGSTVVRYLCVCVVCLNEGASCIIEQSKDIKGTASQLRSKILMGMCVGVKGRCIS